MGPVTTRGRIGDTMESERLPVLAKAASDSGRFRKLQKARPSILRRSRDELLSPKVFLLLSVLLATSLFLCIDNAPLIVQELSGPGHPNIGSGSFDSNRPIGACAPIGSVPKVHHGSGSCPLHFVLSLSQESLIEVQGSTSFVQLSVTLVSGVSVSVTMSANGAPDNT